MDAVIAATAGPGIIIAVDGGGSKTDAVGLDESGNLVARAHGDGSSPHLVGLGASVRSIGSLVGLLLAQSGASKVERAHIYLSGLDLSAEVDAFRIAIADQPWAQGHVVVDNDLLALLRAGTSERDAVAVVCGTGINCIGVRADGAVVRYASLGMSSGDWGGGFALGEWALWHAARCEDGRGPDTALRQEVPRALGLTTVQEVTEALHFGRLAHSSLARLSPVVFAASAAGDSVAARIVDRQAQEIVTLAVNTMRRLELTTRSIPVVIGGGVIAGRDPRLLEAIDRGLTDATPHAHLEIVASPPILGAALLALEASDATETALATARAALSVEIMAIQ
jgi:N-acetylglucosamine kinase-like BadF-type ATPase